MKKVELLLVSHWIEEDQEWSNYELFIHDDPNVEPEVYFEDLYGECNYEIKHIDNMDLAGLENRLRI